MKSVTFFYAKIDTHKGNFMSGFFSAIGSLISTLFWVALTLAVIFGVIAFVGYNKLRHLSESVKETWSNVTVVQHKQISLINQLLDVVKGYQESEKLVILKVSEDASNTASVAQMYQQSGMVLSTVSGMAQKFPELKANEQYKRLIDSIQTSERELEVARQKFNQSVKDYNIQRSSIPHVFYSATLGFRAASYLEFSGSEQVSDMGTLKSFSSDADGDRLNQLLSAAGGRAMEIGGKAFESGRFITAKAIEGGKALAENAQEKMRDISDKAEKNEHAAPPPPPPQASNEPEALYYFLDVNNQAQGPVKMKTLKDDVLAGRLHENVMVAEVGSPNWIPLPTLSAV